MVGRDFESHASGLQPILLLSEISPHLPSVGFSHLPLKQLLTVSNRPLEPMDLGSGPVCQLLWSWSNSQETLQESAQCFSRGEQRGGRGEQLALPFPWLLGAPHQAVVALETR